MSASKALQWTIGSFAALMVLALVWCYLPGFALSLLSQCCAAVLICASLRLLTGLGGIISFGHALYVGAGAYATVHLMQLVDAGSFGVPLVLAPLAGGVAALLVAVISGWLCTRRHDPIFMAMVTLALCELAYTLAQMWPAVFGYEGGLQFDRTAGNFWGIDFVDERMVVYTGLLYLAVCLVLLHAFTRTPAGKWLVAAREDEVRVSSLGMYPERIRYLAFLVSGFFAGIGGGLVAIELEGAHASLMSVAHSGEYLMFTYLGGLGSALGSLLGGIVLTLSTRWLPALTPVWELYLGLVFVYVLLNWPKGLLGAVTSLGRQWMQHPEWRKAMCARFLSRLCICVALVFAIEWFYGLWEIFLREGQMPPLQQSFSYSVVAALALAMVAVVLRQFSLRSCLIQNKRQQKKGGSA